MKWQDYIIMQAEEMIVVLAGVKDVGELKSPDRRENVSSDLELEADALDGAVAIGEIAGGMKK